MNFLAHFQLAQPTEESRVGAILGDFVRGRPETLVFQYPPAVIEGILLHRAIDRFTDDDPAFQLLKPLLAPERRRFAGIIIDIYFDHFLTCHWHQFESQPLPEFISSIHSLLETRAAWLPPKLQLLLPRIHQEGWLNNHATLAGSAKTLRRVSERRPFLKPLAGSEEDLKRHYQVFELHFLEFYPRLLTFARNWSLPPSGNP